MSNGSSDSESISECEFETTSESDKESIRGCYNNEPKYSQQEIDKMKEKNESVSEKKGSKEDDTRLGNTTQCTCKNCKFYENMNTESCKLQTQMQTADKKKYNELKKQHKPNKNTKYKIQYKIF